MDSVSWCSNMRRCIQWFLYFLFVLTLSLINFVVAMKMACLKMSSSIDFTIKSKGATYSYVKAFTSLRNKIHSTKPSPKAWVATPCGRRLLWHKTHDRVGRRGRNNAHLIHLMGLLNAQVQVYSQFCIGKFHSAVQNYHSVVCCKKITHNKLEGDFNIHWNTHH